MNDSDDRVDVDGDDRDDVVGVLQRLLEAKGDQKKPRRSAISVRGGEKQCGISETYISRRSGGHGGEQNASGILMSRSDHPKTRF